MPKQILDVSGLQWTWQRRSSSIQTVPLSTNKWRSKPTEAFYITLMELLHVIFLSSNCIKHGQNDVNETQIRAQIKSLKTKDKQQTEWV